MIVALAGVAPLFILSCLFLAQASLGLLWLFDPLARYVFVAAAIVIIAGIGRVRVKQIGQTSQPRATADMALWVVAFSSTLSLCLLLLLISWSNGGREDISAIGGIIPYSDASDYVVGAEHLLFNGHFTPWAERRPLNAAFLAARLWATNHNLYGALIIQALLAGFATFIAAAAIFQTHGRTATLLFFVLTFAFLSCCLHRTLSEPLGITLGLFAFALLWSGVANERIAPYALGSFVLGLALLARAGAMFVIPTTIIFGLVCFSQTQPRRVLALGATMAAVICAWLVNSMLLRTAGSGKGAMLSNFSYTIYGLSRGSANWRQAIADYPSLPTMNEADAASFLYRKAAEAVMANPALLLWGLTKSLIFGLAQLPAHMLRLIVDGSDGGTPWRWAHLVAIGFVVLPVGFIGLATLLRSGRPGRDRFHLFLLLQALGFVLSLPFFYLDGGIRLTAATFPLLAAMVALTGAAAINRSSRSADARVSPRIGISAMGGAMIIVVAAIVATRMGEQPNVQASPAISACAEGEDRILIRMGSGSPYIDIDAASDRPSIAPRIGRSDFSISRAVEGQDQWQALVPPVTVLGGFDRVAGAWRLIAGPFGFADGPARVSEFCAKPLHDDIFTHRLLPE